MIAFIFPGQGSQKVGMGQAFAAADPIVRATFDEADAALGALRQSGGETTSLSRLCFDGPEADLQLTENTQPAILTVSVAIARVLEARGWRPDFYAGHSLGEYSAHVAAGTFAFADAVRTVRNRGRYMQEAVPVGTGAMAAILGLDGDAVAAACAEAAQGEVVSPANLNGAGQVVIAGTVAGVQRAGALAKAAGAKRVIPLAVSAPFHCALMKPAEDRLAPELRALTVQAPRRPVVANVDAEPKRDGHAAIEALVRQVSGAVRWEAVVRRLASEGVRTYVEVGPGTVLAGLVRKIDREARVVSLEDPAGLDALAPLFGPSPAGLPA
jgi:[acyl-carrier-protein] S-malonyltransferase